MVTRCHSRKAEMDKLFLLREEEEEEEDEINY